MGVKYHGGDVYTPTFCYTFLFRFCSLEVGNHFGPRHCLMLDLVVDPECLCQVPSHPDDLQYLGRIFK